MPGIESTGETAEKIRTVIRFPVLMRVVLPGVLAATAIFPFTGTTSALFNLHSMKELDEHWA